MKKILIFLFLLSAIVAYLLYSKKTEKIVSSSVSSVNNSIPSSSSNNHSKTNTFTFKSLDNEVFTLHVVGKKLMIDKLKNKIIFLKIFGWECEYCQKEIPELIELKNDFFDTFDVIAIESQKHSDKENREEIKKHKINYHIVSGNGQEDFYAYLKREYNWQGLIPLTMIIGEGGEVLAFEEGFKSYTLAGLLKMALEQRAIKKQID